MGPSALPLQSGKMTEFDQSWTLISNKMHIWDGSFIM